jgi:hypothetical protein
MFNNFKLSELPNSAPSPAKETNSSDRLSHRGLYYGEGQGTLNASMENRRLRRWIHETGTELGC